MPGVNGLTGFNVTSPVLFFFCFRCTLQINNCSVSELLIVKVQIAIISMTERASSALKLAKTILVCFHSNYKRKMCFLTCL